MEFYVKNYRGAGIADSDAIDACLAEAKKAEGVKTVILDGEDYYLDRAILVFDDLEVIVDGCMLKQKKHVFDNFFRSENFIVDPENPYGVPLEVNPVKNVKILGRNGASLYGTAWPRVGYHPFFEQDQLMVGDFWGYRTHMFNFALADTMEIGGFLLRQTMGWALSFEESCNVHIHDLEIHSHVKNGDGIDFRSGCHHCLVENISGTTSDDTIACTALAKREYPNPMPLGKGVYPGEPYHRLVPSDNRDIHDITIRNVTTGGRMHGVIVLAANGNKVYNINIEDICEVADGGREATVKLYTGYGTGYTKGDIHDIHLKNIRSKSAHYAVMVAAEVENVTVEDVYQDNPEGELTSGI
ncbi:MAG: hypothetical protein IJN74_02595 [Clostridia bacterium]|nr:hypothetical protein [Clostridia bacterium]